MRLLRVVNQSQCGSLLAFSLDSLSLREASCHVLYSPCDQELNHSTDNHEELRPSAISPSWRQNPQPQGKLQMTAISYDTQASVAQLATARFLTLKTVWDNGYSLFYTIFEETCYTFMDNSCNVWILPRIYYFFKDFACPHYRKGMPFDIWIGGILGCFLFICSTLTWDPFSLLSVPFCSKRLIPWPLLPSGFQLVSIYVQYSREQDEREIWTSIPRTLLSFPPA